MKAVNAVFVLVWVTSLSTACSQGDSASAPPASPSPTSETIEEPSTSASSQETWEGKVLIAGADGQTIEEYPVTLTITKNSESNYTYYYEEIFEGEVYPATCSRSITALENNFEYVETTCGKHKEYSVCNQGLCSGEFTSPDALGNSDLHAMSELTEENRLRIHYNLMLGVTLYGIPDVYAMTYDLSRQQ